MAYSEELANGNMFCGVTQDTLMARVGPNNYDAALAKPYVRVMDFTGRSMKGYVYVDAAGIATDQGLRFWVELCAEYVVTLPSK